MSTPAPEPFVTVSENERKALLQIARSTLESLSEPTEAVKDYLDRHPHGAGSQPLPCFVTLYTGAGRLRGCIGCLHSDAPLAETIGHYTLLAATDDPRFRPVTKAEASTLKLHVSVLGPLRPLPHLKALTLGRHGLCVEKGPHRGVLLADVATQFGWGKEQFLAETFRKAGLPAHECPDAHVSYFEQVSFGE